MKNPTNKLFAMTRYCNAYRNGHIMQRLINGKFQDCIMGRITRRWNHGKWHYCTAGWVPNTFLVGSDTAGMNGRNEMTSLKREYPGFFETITRIEFIDRYGVTTYLGTANYDFNRISPAVCDEKTGETYREKWTAIVEQAEADWTAKHGELIW